MPDQNCACERLETMELPVRGLRFDVDKSAFSAVEGLSRDEAAQMIAEALQDFSGGTGEAPAVSTRVWESDWFSIAPKGCYTFMHNLGLEAAERCRPRLVFRVEIAQSGWIPGDILCLDGTNYNGSTGGEEFGWAISPAPDSVLVSFGNHAALAYNAKAGGFGGLNKTSVKCKLILEY